MDGMVPGVGKQVLAVGSTTEEVSRILVDQLRGPELRLAIMFADWQLDAAVLAREVQRGLSPAPLIGGTTLGVIARGAPLPSSPPTCCAAVGLGLYGDWVRVGIGVGRELSSSALSRSRDAV